MSVKVKIGSIWRGYPRGLMLGSLVVCLASPIALANDDLGVTMRMVTDEDLTEAVTREIVLPEPERPEGDRQGRSNGSGNSGNAENPFMDGDHPGKGRGRPELNPSEMRDEASDNARDRRSDARRSAPPARPGNSARPDRPGRPDHARPPDRPGNGNRP